MSLLQSAKKFVAALGADIEDVVATLEKPFEEVENEPVVEALASPLETFVKHKLAEFGVDPDKIETAGKELLDGLSQFGASAAEAKVTGETAEVPAVASTLATTTTSASTDLPQTADQPAADTSSTTTTTQAE